MDLINVSEYRESIARIASEIPIDEGNILVTGASGLIGSCLVDAFEFANQSYGKKFKIIAMGRNERFLISRFGYSSSIKYLVEDITNNIDSITLDYIVHAASNADPRSYALFPVETMLTNVVGAKNILEICRNKHTRVLLTSTFEVYGKLDKDEYGESDFGLVNMNEIRSCYPESKRNAELLFRAYYDEYGVDAVIARLSSVYGPTMKRDDSKAHAQFIRNAINGEDIVLKSEGKQKRTYCYVMDAISGIIKVLFNGSSGEAYNVANENSVATIAEVAETIAAIAGTNVVFDLPDEIERKGFSIPQNCVLNTRKIKFLGWNGKYSLEDGIRETLMILQKCEGQIR